MANLTTYTDEQAANALAMLEANGGNAKKTAALLGIPRTTLRAWVGRSHSRTARPKKVPAKLVQDRSAEIADSLENLAAKAVGLADGKAEAATYKDLLIGAGIAIEKVQLLRGRATTRSESLRIELVSGESLRALADRVMHKALPERIDAPIYASPPKESREQATTEQNTQDF
jgi:regulatory Fis family protein